MKNFKRSISDDITVIIQDTGLIEIWNDLEDGSRSGVGVTYAEIVALKIALTDAQNHIHDQLLRDIVAVQYLLLQMGQMATKDITEDIIMHRLELDRGTIHHALNMLTENGHRAFKRAPGDAAGWTWTQPDMPEPQLSDYPEIERVLKTPVKGI